MSPTASPFDLTGRRALVTGASRGIGAATAAALDRAGARVALVARSEADLAVAAAALTNHPVSIAADLADDAALGRVHDATVDQLGGLDILVNNAGIGVRQPTHEMEASTIDSILTLNVRNLLLLTRSFLPQLTAGRHSSIVNLSSVSGVTGTPNRAAYAASKAAVDGLTRSLARELGRDGIRVNAVAPGAIETDMWARNRAIPGVIEQVEALTALGRWGTPEDIADAIVFLASDASRYLTGATLPVDGGMTTTLDLYGGAV